MLGSPPFLLLQSETGFLQYLDVSVGKEVATLCTKGGRLGVMAQNPSNAIIHLGHSNGESGASSPPPSPPPPGLSCLGLFSQGLTACLPPRPRHGDIVEPQPQGAAGADVVPPRGRESRGCRQLRDVSGAFI